MISSISHSLSFLFPIGANWDAVAQYVDMSGSLEGFDAAPKTGNNAPKRIDSSNSDDLKTISGVLKIIWKASFTYKIFNFFTRAKPKAPSPKTSVTSSFGKESYEGNNRPPVVATKVPNRPRFPFSWLYPHRPISPNNNDSYATSTATPTASGALAAVAKSGSIAIPSHARGARAWRPQQCFRWRGGAGCDAASIGAARWRAAQAGVGARGEQGCGGVG